MVGQGPHEGRGNRLWAFNTEIMPNGPAAVPTPPAGRPEDIDGYTFIRASVWADDIKTFKVYPMPARTTR